MNNLIINTIYSLKEMILDTLKSLIWMGKVPIYTELIIFICMALLNIE